MLNLFVPIIFSLMATIMGIFSLCNASSFEERFRDYRRYNDQRREKIRDRQRAIERSTRPATSPIIPGLNLPLPTDEEPAKQALKKKTSKVKTKAEEPAIELKPNPNKLVRPDEFFDEPRQE